MKPINLTIVLDTLSDMCSKSKHHRGYVKLNDLVDRILDDHGHRSADNREFSSETILKLLHEGKELQLCHDLGRDRWKSGPKHDRNIKAKDGGTKTKTKNLSNEGESQEKAEKKSRKAEKREKRTAAEALLKQLIALQQNLLESPKSVEKKSNGSMTDDDDNQLLFIEPGRHKSGKDEVCVECGRQVDRGAKSLYIDQYTLRELLRFLSEIDDKEAK